METAFEFKSQATTLKRLSDRLLALGLNKATSDGYLELTGNAYIRRLGTPDYWSEGNEIVPVWSLDRLIELTKYPEHYSKFEENSSLRKDMFQDMFSSGDTYDTVIKYIEKMINEGCFNRNYLDTCPGYNETTVILDFDKIQEEAETRAKSFLTRGDKKGHKDFVNGFLCGALWYNKVMDEIVYPWIRENYLNYIIGEHDAEYMVSDKCWEDLEKHLNEKIQKNGTAN